MIKKRLLGFALISTLMFSFTSFTQCAFAAGNKLINGAWIGTAPTSTNIKEMQDLQQRKLDIIQTYINWATNFSSIKSSADAVYANGSILMITWEAWDYDTVRIKNGEADNYIKQMANDIKAYGKEIWLRPLHEANGNWYPWGIGDSKVNTNETCAAAYRHIVDIFRAQGVTNVKWLYTVNCSNVGQGTSFTAQYPGDSYVDYNSIDGYNWGTTQSWGSKWQSFDEIFSASYNALKQYNKPIMITEWASAEQGGNKSTWITNSFNTIKSSYDKITAVMWFNENKETDWRINSSAASLEAYKKAIADGTPLIKLGDVNGDGRIDVLDATMLKQYVQKKKPITIFADSKFADMNNDGSINSIDYLLLIKAIKAQI